MYITTSVSTLFPIVATRPSGFRFRPMPKTNARLEASANKLVAPLYPTEMDVTRALAAGILSGLASTHYAAAKNYQHALKLQRRKQN